VSAAPAAAPERATNWIVTVQRGVDARSAAPGLARKVGGRSGRIFEHALRGFVFRGSARAAQALKKTPGIRTVVPDGPVKIVADTLTPGIERIRADHPGGTVVAVSHADPIKAAAADAVGTPLDLFQRIVISPCSVTAILYGDSSPVALTVNSTGDLKALAPS